MTKTIEQIIKENNLIKKNKSPIIETLEYDKNGNLIHFKDSNRYESWGEYDKEGNELHFKDSNGYESWIEYDSNGKWINELICISNTNKIWELNGEELIRKIK